MKNKLTTYRAVGLAEGFEEGTEEEVIEAWQYLHDRFWGILNQIHHHLRHRNQ